MPGSDARARRRLRRAIAVLALVATVSGCGGAAKGNFVASADAICASTVRAIRSIPPPSLTGGSRQQLSALTHYLADVLPVVQSEANQFRSLRRFTLTAHERAALASYLGALNQTIGAYRSLAAAASRNDAQGVASAEATLRASAAPAIAARYRLRSCGAAGATVA